MQSIEPQSSNDQCREITDSAIWNISYKSKKDEEPGFVVHVGFFDLRPVDAALLDSGLVLSHACDHEEFLVVTEAPECDG